jgi:DNA-binding LytR/AlgR family response regulator
MRNPSHVGWIEIDTVKGIEKLDRLKIALCDANDAERKGFAAICRSICEKAKVSADIKLYSDSNDVLFDMSDNLFSSQVSILIIDPENGLETVPSQIRDAGYDGLILYLSHSSSSDHFRQAWDVSAFNFVAKGADEQALSRFGDVFAKAIQTAKKINRQYFVASYGGEYRKIEIRDIYYFEVLPHHMAKVVYRGGDFTFFVSSLKELEERFRERGFVRSHQSFLVAVDSIHRVGSTELTLNNNRRIPVSRNKAPLVRAAVLAH